VQREKAQPLALVEPIQPLDLPRTELAITVLNDDIGFRTVCWAGQHGLGTKMERRTLSPQIYPETELGDNESFG